MADPSIADDEAERKREEKRIRERARYHEKKPERTEEWLTARRNYRRRHYLENLEKYRAQSAAAYTANKEERRRQIHTNYLRTKEKVSERSKRDYVANRQSRQAQMQEWNKRNRHKFVDYSRAWRERNPEKVREGVKRWKQMNPEKARAIDTRNKAKRRGASGSFTASDIAEIRKQQKDRCAYCRVTLAKKGEVDHILPVTLGGSNHRRNLQLTCRVCNNKKRAKDAIVFAQETGRLL